MGVKINIVKTALKKSLPLIAATALLYAIYELASTALAAGLGELFNVAVGSDMSEHEISLQRFLLLFILLLIVVLTFSVLSSKLQASCFQRICTNIRVRYFSILLKKPIADYNKNDKSHYQSVLINDMKQLELAFLMPLFAVIKKTISVLIPLCVLVFYSIPVFLFVLFTGCLPFLIPKSLEKNLRTEWKSIA